MSRSPSSAYRRATCLWLAELATWRAGVIGRLLQPGETLDDVLQRPRAQIAGALARSRVGSEAPRRRGGASSTSPGGNEHAPTAGEGAAWRSALARLAPGAALGAPPGGAVVTYVDEAYPAPLRHLHDPPPALFLLTSVDACEARSRLAAVMRGPRVVVVGTRRPSAYGLEMAAGVSRGLGQQRCVVVSGLALGIDAAAHRGALEAAAGPSTARAAAEAGPRSAADGAGRVQPFGPPTVAVTGCGADVCYPRAHGALRREVLDRGLIVSEFLWGAGARSWRFPSRNRVMAALGHALVVVEGALCSGALITVRHALETGREVLAVPGEAGRRVSEGPHALLRGGAAVCESADCVVAALVGVWPSDPAVLWPWVAGVRERLDPCFPELVCEADGLPAKVAGEGRGGHTARASAGTPVGSTAGLTAAERSVYAIVDAGRASADTVAVRTGLPIADALATLGALEMAGHVAQLPDGCYRAVRDPQRRR